MPKGKRSYSALTALLWAGLWTPRIYLHNERLSFSHIGEVRLCRSFSAELYISDTWPFAEQWSFSAQNMQKQNVRTGPFCQNGYTENSETRRCA